MHFQRGVFVALASACTGVFAQNVVPNPQFDSADSLDNWPILYGLGATLTLDASDGSPETPSAFLRAGSSQASLAYSTCIPFSPTTAVDLQADIKSDPGALPDFPGHVSVYAYGDASCSGRADVFAATTCFALSDGWQRCSNLGLALPQGTSSVNVVLSVLRLTVSAKFDNIRLGPTGTVPVTLQSFDID
jgi:hypothetical protein